MSFHVLSAPIRHACTSCGASCQGHKVRLQPDEAEGIRRAGALLGVVDPIDGEKLAFRGGSCVFLGEDQRCEIHRRLGAEHKPAVCRQYPLLAVRAGEELRVAIDPGCFSDHLSWREGPEVRAGAELAVQPVAIGAEDAAFERALLALSEAPDATVWRVLAWLLGQPPDAGLPADFAGRWVARLHASGVDTLLDLPDAAPAMRAVLGPVLERARGWRPERPPPAPELPPAQQAYALDVLRRVIFLRQYTRTQGSAPAGALLVLGGILTLAWAAPEPERFGRGLAAWCRALRAPAFSRALLPDTRTLQALVGER